MIDDQYGQSTNGSDISVVTRVHTVIKITKFYVRISNCLNKIDTNTDIDCTRGSLSAVNAFCGDGGGSDGADLPRDLQLALNIRSALLLSTLLQASDAPPRAAAIGLTERANAISPVYASYFIPRTPLTPGGRIIRVLRVCACGHTRAWRTHAADNASARYNTPLSPSFWGFSTARRFLSRLSRSATRW